MCHNESIVFRYYQLKSAGHTFGTKAVRNAPLEMIFSKIWVVK